jgi:hypothetical protein
MKIEDILSSLPSKEDIAAALGRQARGNGDGDMFAALGIFGAGMLIGAGLALLFAPKPGPELRQDLADRFNEVGERFTNRSHSTPGQSDA